LLGAALDPFTNLNDRTACQSNSEAVEQTYIGRKDTDEEPIGRWGTSMLFYHKLLEEGSVVSSCLYLVLQGLDEDRDGENQQN
jgi:hypothetical protein